MTAQFSGSTIQTTETFNIPTSEGRVTWNITPNTQYPDAALFQVWIYKSNGDLVTLFTGDSTANNGTSYIHHGPGNYYLNINPANCNYNINIQYQEDAPTANPTQRAADPYTLGQNVGLIAIAAVIVIAVLLYLRNRKYSKPLPPPPAP